MVILFILKTFDISWYIQVSYSIECPSVWVCLSSCLNSGNVFLVGIPQKWCCILFFFFFFAIDKEAYDYFLSHYWALTLMMWLRLLVQFATVITVSSFVIIYREIPLDSVHISVTPNFTLYFGIHWLLLWWLSSGDF